MNNRDVGYEIFGRSNTFQLSPSLFSADTSRRSCIIKSQHAGQCHLINPLAVSAYLPCAEGNLSLFSLHNQTINLLTTHQEIITLHRYDSGLSPMGWLLKSHHFDYLHNVICEAIAFDSLDMLTMYQLANGDLRIHDIQLVRKSRELTMIFGNTQNNKLDKQFIAELFKQMDHPTGLFGSLQQNITDKLEPQLLSLCQQISVLMNNKSADLTPFIGLGPGLTPSFDDIIVGIMAVLSRDIHCASKLDLLTKSILTLPLESLTTKVSATFLMYASKGIFSRHILELIVALSQYKYWHPAIANTLNYGHTSGADLLLGIWLGIYLLELEG